MTVSPETLQGAHSTTYTVVRQQVRQEGVCALPTDGDPEILTLFAPVEAWCISWVAVKHGEPPTVPHPTDLDPNLVFKHGTRGAAYPMNQATGIGRIWAMSGQYYYVAKVSKGLASDMPTGKMPWQPEKAENNVIPAKYFDQSLSGTPAKKVWEPPS